MESRTGAGWLWLETRTHTSSMPDAPFRRLPLQGSPFGESLRPDDTGLAELAFNELRERIADCFAGGGEGKIGRMDNRARKINGRLDQRRLRKSARSEVGEVAYGENGAASLVSHRPHFTHQ